MSRPNDRDRGREAHLTFDELPADLRAAVEALEELHEEFAHLAAEEEQGEVTA